MHVVATTRDVLWVDERMPGRDVLRYAHDRVGKEGKGPDRTLALTEVPSTEQRQRLALHSRNHPLVTLYSYSSSPTQPPRSLLDPYSLTSPTRSTTDPFVRAGLAFLPLFNLGNSTTNGNPANVPEQSWLVSEVGADGAVFQRAYTTAEDAEEEDEDAPPSSAVVSTWSEEIDRVRTDFESRAAEGVDGGAIGGKEGAETKEFHMVKVAQAIQRHLPEEEEDERALQEKVDRAVELMIRAKGESERGLRLGDSGVLTACVESLSSRGHVANLPLSTGTSS